MTGRLPAQMVCINTRQAVTNAIPAAEIGAERVLCLSTAFASRRRWSDGLPLALPDTRWDNAEVPADADEDPVAFAYFAERSVQSQMHSGEPIAIAWGGGKKTQSTGLWLYFQRLHEAQPQAGHVALYVDPQAQSMLCWRRPDASPEYIPLRGALRLDAYVRAMGFEPMRRGRRLWPDPEPEDAWVKEAYDLFSGDASFRRVCFQAASAAAEVDAAGRTGHERRELAVGHFERSVGATWIGEWAIERMRKENKLRAHAYQHGPLLTQIFGQLRAELRNRLRRTVDAPRIALPPGDTRAGEWLRKACRNEVDAAGSVAAHGLRLSPDPEAARFPQLFERMVAHRVGRWLARKEHHVCEARAGYEVREQAGESAVGEFDVILLTRSGRPVVLDAKTFLSGPIHRAQLHTVERIGGPVSTRRVVFPCFAGDRGRASSDRAPELWGAEPWMPVGLLKGLHLRLRGERKDLTPFDEGSALEDDLDLWCGAR